MLTAIIFSKVISPYLEFLWQINFINWFILFHCFKSYAIIIIIIIIIKTSGIMVTCCQFSKI